MRDELAAEPGGPARADGCRRRARRAGRRPACGPRRVRGDVRRVRRRASSASSSATRSRSREGRRHLLDQGRRRQDVGRGQPRRARRARRAADGDLGPRPAGRRVVPVPRRAEGQGRQQAAHQGAPRADRRHEGHRHRGPRPAAGGLLLPPPRHPARQAQEAAGGRSSGVLDQLDGRLRPGDPRLRAVDLARVGERVHRRRPAARAARARRRCRRARYEQLQALPRRRAAAGAGRARVLLDGRSPQAPAQGADGDAAAASPRRRSRPPARSS